MQFTCRIYLEYSGHEPLFCCLPSAGPHVSQSRTGHTDVTSRSHSGDRDGAIHFMQIPCQTLCVLREVCSRVSREWLCLDVTWLTYTKADRVPGLVFAAAQQPWLRPRAGLELHHVSSATVGNSLSVDSAQDTGRPNI